MLLSHDFSGARNEFVAARALTPECPSALANLESSNLLARPPRPQRGNHLLFSFTANLDSRSRWACTTGTTVVRCKLLILLARADLLILEISQKWAVCGQKCGTDKTKETKTSCKVLKTWTHPPGLNRRPTDTNPRLPRCDAIRETESLGANR